MTEPIQGLPIPTLDSTIKIKDAKRAWSEPAIVAEERFDRFGGLRAEDNTPEPVNAIAVSALMGLMQI